MITARDAVEDRIAGPVEDRIAGLDLGADDYLVKPFLVEELMARVRAVTRRQSGSAQPLLSNGHISINPADKSASYKEQPLDLTGKEYQLLHALVRTPGRIFSREELEEKVYGWGEEVNSNAIEVVIFSLRKKLHKTAIKNVRGLGWMVPKE